MWSAGSMTIHAIMCVGQAHGIPCTPSALDPVCKVPSNPVGSGLLHPPHTSSQGAVGAEDWVAEKVTPAVKVVSKRA